MKLQNRIGFCLNTKIHISLMILVVFSISGCNHNELISERYYEIGKVNEVKLGEPLCVYEEGIRNYHYFVGLVHGGYKTKQFRFEDGHKRKKIIYQGCSDSIVNVSYIIYKAGSTIPEQQESKNFSLLESDTIRVEEFQLKVLKADNDSIQYIVLSDSLNE
jgi:hypothetical protein